MPTSIEMLTPIWERVLQQASVGVHDNFFDLGGDSTRALELFTEIARVTGREIPPVMIYQSPTISQLAVALDQPSLPRFAPLVALKAGTENPPLFITHGMGGNVMDFFQVVKHMRTDRAIYGMQAKGLDGVEEPFERIEDMAQFFLDAIRKVQPQGPYLLAGYSLGGLVALEMAQLLRATGERVALLALVESYPHKRYLPKIQRMKLLFQRLQHRAAALWRLRPQAAYAYLRNPAERMAPIARDSKQSGPSSLPLDVWFTPAILRMRDQAYLALQRYRPRFYPDRISFVRAEIPTEFPRDAAACWKRLAADFEIATAPGDHRTIMNTCFKQLAEVLSKYLDSALGGGRSGTAGLGL